MTLTRSSYLPGAEEGQGGWGLWITGPAPVKSFMASFANGFFSDFVLGKSDWDYKTYKVDADLKAANERTAQALNATDRPQAIQSPRRKVGSLSRLE
jgi:hypothetical protein